MDQKERKVDKRRKNNQRNRKRGKRKMGGGGSVLFACLGGEEAGPGIVEIPESGANSAFRHTNLTNAPGDNGLGRRNWEKECSSIIDTCFNGGGYVVSLG